MDVSSSQSQPAEAPRHLFFGAEDRRLGGRAGLTDKYLTMEKARRHQLAEHVINTANQLANAVRTLRTFDRTGSAEQALDHIEATFEDLTKQTRNLVNEVHDAVDRHGEGLAEPEARDADRFYANDVFTYQAEGPADNDDEDVVLNAPAAAVPAPQPPAAAGPKPGPGTIVVTPAPRHPMYLTEEAYARMSLLKAQR